MGIFVEFLKDKILYVVLALGLSSGLIGAYGRERHEQRNPNANWWISRLCIIPFLAIVASAAVEQFHLTNQQAAFLAAVLSLMGYEAVRIIIERAKLRGGAATAAIAAEVPEGSRPYHSVIDTDHAGRATAHVEPTDPLHPRRSGIGKALRESLPLPEDDGFAADMRGILGDEI
jgi:hypothetical protein